MNPVTAPAEKAPAEIDTFAKWLLSVPSLQDANGEEITIQVSITLEVSKWLDIAHVAAVHGDSLEAAINTIIDDASTEHNFMNDPRQYRGEERDAADEELTESFRQMQAEAAAQKPPLEGEEWKDGGTQEA